MIYGLIIFFQLLALAFFVPGFFYWKGRHSDAIKKLVELDDKIKEFALNDKSCRELDNTLGDYYKEEE